MRQPEERSSSNASQAAAYIKQRVISGEFPPGMRLTEEKLAHDIGTSRTPVREAMRVLTADGFLSFKPNSGTYVNTWTTDEVREIFDLRTYFESEIAAAAAPCITEHQLALLESIEIQCEALGAIDNMDKIHARTTLNQAFHRVIAEASGKPKLVAALGNVIEMPIVHQTLMRYSPQQAQRSLTQHREIIDALASADAQWARAAMTCHIRAARFVHLGRDR